MARKSLPGSEFEGEFCKVAAQHPTCSLIAPNTLFLAPESEYPEVWGFASVELVERLSLSRIMKMIHGAEDLIKSEATRQVSSADVLNINGAAVASMISRTPTLFRASFPSLKLVCGMSDNGTEARHSEITADEWFAMLESPWSSRVPFVSGASVSWSVPEALILGMAAALLPPWKLVERSVTNDYCKSIWLISSSCLLHRRQGTISRFWSTARQAAWLHYRLPQNAPRGHTQHVIKILRTPCEDKLDRAKSGCVGQMAGYKSPNGRGLGKTFNDMANQDDNEDFSAVDEAIRKDNEDFTRPKVADNEDRKHPLLFYSPPSKISKSPRKATNACRNLGIRVRGATMEI